MNKYKKLLILASFISTPIVHAQLHTQQAHQIGDLNNGSQYLIQAAHSNKYLEVFGGEGAKSGADVIQYHAYIDDKTQQQSKSMQWIFSEQGQGLFTIKSPSTHKLLTVEGGSEYDHANVIQFRKQLAEDGSIVASQLWRVEFSEVDPGLVEIRNEKSGKLLEIYGGETAKHDLASAIQYSKYDGVSGDQSKSQLWRLKEVQYESAGDNPTFHIERNTSKPIKLIYDGDVGPDPCDYATVGMLMEYHKANKIDLLGIITSQPDNNAVPTYDYFNRYYDLDIPISGYDPALFSPIARKYHDLSSAGSPLYLNVQAPPNYILDKTLLQQGQAPDPIELYKTLLSQEEDQSVVIYVGGPTINLIRLLSDNEGTKELVKRKVSQFVFMGGDFPNKTHDRPTAAEWNFANYEQWGTTKEIIENLQALEIPTTYIGYEVAYNTLMTGGGEFDSLPLNHPVRTAYRTLSPVHPFTGVELGAHIDNHAFDEVALYYIVEGGVGKYFNRVDNGYVEIYPNNANDWQSYDDGARGSITTESYLELNREYANELTSILDNRILGVLD